MLKNSTAIYIIATMDKYISPTIFYDIMKYPTPNNVSDFYWLEENTWNLTDASIENNTETEKFSRDEHDQLMSDYIFYINKYGRLYKSIPFVSNIYIANSLTFNTLNPNSDIDLVIVSKPWFIWLARFWSWFLFWILGIKVSWKNKAKKFCLSCYMSSDSLNLYHISIMPVDILLIYRIVHFVPLYAENSRNIDDIYKANHWITNFLPNIKLTQNIHLNNTLFTGNGRFKEFIEKIVSYNYLAVFYNWLLKKIRLPILNYKTKKLWAKWRWVIHNDHILKFHLDIRKKVFAKYKIATNRISPNNKSEENYHNSLFEYIDDA